MSTDLGWLELAGPPVDRETQFEVEQFLYWEAELNDDKQYDRWLELFDDDLEYRAPVRIWRADSRLQVDPIACLWNDTKRTLSIRLERINSGFAWAEQPPSVTRHFVSNVRVSPGPTDGELIVRSNVLVTRSRGPATPQELIPADRFDILRRAESTFRISRRTVIIDSTNPDVQNLAIFI